MPRGTTTRFPQSCPPVNLTNEASANCIIDDLEQHSFYSKLFGTELAALACRALISTRLWERTVPSTKTLIFLGAFKDLVFCFLIPM